MYSQQLNKQLLVLMTATTGLVVANIYYNQPLLVLMTKTFNVNAVEISSVPMFTQIGYALGLFFVVPLGDKLKRKKLILTDFVFIIASLLFAAFSQSPLQLKIASFLIGFTSIVPQIIVPMAAQLASDEKRGAVIGTVMTGLLIGILGSRTVSGFAGEYFGWRSAFIVAAVLMILLFVMLLLWLPEMKPDFKGNYFSLLRSCVEQFRVLPKLRIACLRGGLNFGCFCLFWTTLTFLLSGPPFRMGSDVAGIMGLVGIAGTLGASGAGRLSDRMHKNTLIVVAVSTIMVSWIILGFSATSMIGLVVGAFVLDFGVQSMHITNQTIILEGNPPERSRINTMYMFMYFVGGALGTLVGGYLWHYFKWHGIVFAGFTWATLSLAITLLFTKQSDK